MVGEVVALVADRAIAFGGESADNRTAIDADEATWSTVFSAEIVLASGRQL